MNTNGWAITTRTEEFGSADFDPENRTLALTVARGKYRVTANRVATNNYDRPMTDAEVRKAATTRTDELSKDARGRPQLELGHRDDKGTTTYQTWDET